MEFNASPHPDKKAVGFRVDRKITMLKILMGERFGDLGTKTYEDWLMMVAANACEDGGPRAA